MNITSKIINVSPKIALYYLEKNNVNRAITKSKILSYSTQMLEGNWKLNGENIIISENRMLLNGQHRLKAVIKADITVPMSFIFGIQKNTFDTIDTGKNRSASDVLTIQGTDPVSSKIISTQIRLNLLLKHSGTLLQSAVQHKNLTPASILKEFNSDIDYKSAVNFITSYPSKTLPISGGQLSFFAYRTFKIDIDFSKQWLDGFITGENLKSDDYRLWLRNKLWRQFNKTEKLNAIEKTYLLIKIWHWERRKIKISCETSLRSDKSILKYISLPNDLK